MSSYRHCNCMYGLFSLFSISRNVTAARFSSISFQFYSYFMCYSIRNPFLKQMIFRFFLSVTFSNPHFYDRMDSNVKWMLIDFNCDDEWWNNYNYHYIHSIGWLFSLLFLLAFISMLELLMFQTFGYYWLIFKSK